MYIIYKTTNLVNNKIYIGKHKTNNLEDDYLGSGNILDSAIKKYGKDKFKRETLYILETEEEMNKMESEIVDEEFVARLDTYNLRRGGNGGFSREEAKLGRRKTDEILEEKYGKSWRKILNEMFYEKLNNNLELKQEHIEKIKDGQKRVFFNHNTFKNKKHTTESKKLIGDKNSIKQKGNGNSQFGTCWIYNLELKQNKSIKKEELNKYLNEGWIKGRKLKF
jgi:hypothetical protein